MELYTVLFLLLFAGFYGFILIKSIYEKSEYRKRIRFQRENNILTNIQTIHEHPEGEDPEQLDVMYRNDDVSIATFAGGTEFTWDGRYLSKFAGSTLIEFDGTHVSKFAGETLYSWDGTHLSSYAGGRVYTVNGNHISKFAGETLYTFDGTQLSRYAGEALYTVNGKVPYPVLIMIAEGLTE